MEGILTVSMMSIQRVVATNGWMEVDSAVRATRVDTAVTPHGHGTGIGHADPGKVEALAVVSSYS